MDINIINVFIVNIIILFPYACKITLNSSSSSWESLSSVKCCNIKQTSDVLLCIYGRCIVWWWCCVIKNLIHCNWNASQQARCCWQQMNCLFNLCAFHLIIKWFIANKCIHTRHEWSSISYFFNPVSLSEWFMEERHSISLTNYQHKFA